MSKIKIGVIGGSGLDDPKNFKNVKEGEGKNPFWKTSSKIITGQIYKQQMVVFARHCKKKENMPTKGPF